jgi:hypothetical protein
MTTPGQAGRRSRVTPLGDHHRPACWYSEAEIEPAPVSVQERVGRGPRVVAVAAGRDHSLFQLDNGAIWGCGSNGCGQLGPATVAGTEHSDERLLWSPQPLQHPPLRTLPAVLGSLAACTFLLRTATTKTQSVEAGESSQHPAGLRRVRSVRLHTPPLPVAWSHEQPPLLPQRDPGPAAGTRGEILPALLGDKRGPQSKRSPSAAARRWHVSKGRLCAFALRGQEPTVLDQQQLATLKALPHAWEDPDFPASMESLAHDWEGLEHTAGKRMAARWRDIRWCTPEQMDFAVEEGASGEEMMAAKTAKAQVLVDDVDYDDVQQGMLGDCYFLSSLAVLAEQPGLITRMLLVDTVLPSGVFGARFYKHGKPHDVLVDAKFPCTEERRDHERLDAVAWPARKSSKYGGGALKASASMGGFAATAGDASDGLRLAPAFSQAKKGELWPVILEKCWAKLHGSYQAIETGDPGQTLRDLTGAPSEHFSCSEPRLMWQALLEARRSGFVVAACMAMAEDGQAGEHERADGLIEGHAYSVLQAAEGTLRADGPRKGEVVRLIRLRNPWGNTEWDGEWSDTSEAWFTEERLAQQMGWDVEDDGTFFMELADFCRHFDGIFVNRCREGWEYAYVDAPPSQLLPSSLALYFRVSIPTAPVTDTASQKRGADDGDDPWQACLTLSQRDHQHGVGATDRPYAVVQLSTVRVSSAPPTHGHGLGGDSGGGAGSGGGIIGGSGTTHESPHTAGSGGGTTVEERSALLGGTPLRQGRECTMETSLPPGEYTVTAHVRLGPGVQPVPELSRMTFSCYCASRARVSLLSEAGAWGMVEAPDNGAADGGGIKELRLQEPLPPLCLASLYHRMTQSIGTSDNAPYIAAGVCEGGLSLRMWSSVSERVLCFLHSNATDKNEGILAVEGESEASPAMLAEEVAFTMSNMEFVRSMQGSEVEEGDNLIVTLAPGESAFTIMRAKHLGRYSINYSREVSIEPV